MVHENKTAVEGLFNAICRGNLEKALASLMAICHPEVLVHEAESLPYGGVYRGPEGFLDVFRRLATHVPDMTEIVVEAIVGDGDNVVVRMRVPWIAPGCADPIEMRISEWYTFREGKLVEVRPYLWDTAVAIGAI